MSSHEPSPQKRFQFSLRSLFILMTMVAVLSAAIRCAPTGPRVKPHKELAHTVFHLGMTADEALCKLPPGHSLEELSIIYDYAPTGPTPSQLANDEYFVITNQESEGVPLFFNHNKRLVRVGPEFDEEKYVSLYEKRK
jgi:hypothetical protein